MVVAVEYSTPLRASVALSCDDAAQQALIAAGWDFDVLENMNEKAEFGVFHRAQRWGGNASSPSNPSAGLTPLPHKTPVHGAGSKALNGTQSAISP